MCYPLFAEALTKAELAIAQVGLFPMSSLDYRIAKKLYAIYNTKMADSNRLWA